MNLYYFLLTIGFGKKRMGEWPLLYQFKISKQNIHGGRNFWGVISLGGVAWSLGTDMQTYCFFNWNLYISLKIVNDWKLWPYCQVVISNGTRSHSEDARGGFVLKSRSDETPVRRRSLVERTGMKNLMQVRSYLG